MCFELFWPRPWCQTIIRARRELSPWFSWTPFSSSRSPDCPGEWGQHTLPSTAQLSDSHNTNKTTLETHNIGKNQESYQKGFWKSFVFTMTIWPGFSMDRHYPQTGLSVDGVTLGRLLYGWILPQTGFP